MNLLQKNLLDLEYQKYLQYLNTTIVAMFTFAIGILIAIFTGQLTRPEMVVLVIALGFVGYTFLFWLLFQFKERMGTIKEEIMKLK